MLDRTLKRVTWSVYSKKSQAMNELYALKSQQKCKIEALNIQMKITMEYYKYC